MTPGAGRPGDASRPAGPVAYGGFIVADMMLALPIDTMREVVPAPEFEPLPCRAPALVGGCRLRGTLIPVIDLRRLFDGPPAAGDLRPRVLVLRQHGQLLGLQVDAVSGVFMPVPGSERRLGRAAGDAAPGTERSSSWYAGTVRRPEDDRVVNLLSAAALFALPDVPHVLDDDVTIALSEAEADGLGAASAGGDGLDAAGAGRGDGDPAPDARDMIEPLMLLHCGGARLAIAATDVHAAVPVGALRPSPLQGDLCVGVIGYAGRDIAAVDLLALLGLGRLSDQRCERACLVQIGDGLVGLLANDVIDVVPLSRRGIAPVPRFVLPRPALVAGALPLDGLPAAVAERMGDAAGQFFVLDVVALRADPLLAGMAQVTTDTPGAGRTADRAAAAAGEPDPRSALGGRPMMIYALHTDVATPVEQVAEVLPYQPCGAAYAAQPSMLGLMSHRGRSIPVMCLCALTGRPTPTDAREACVLVVRQDDDWIGFAVPKLRAIEPARWEPNPAGDGPRGRTPPLAMVGHGDDERMVPVIDLQRLAAELRATAAEPA